MKLASMLFLLFFIAGCSEKSPNVNAGAPEFTLQCDLNSLYTPVAERISSLKTSEEQPVQITVIAIHGKNGSPLNLHMQTLKTNLNAAGYDVIMPYMPWSGIQWDGSLCDGISYINELIIEERNRVGSNYILLVGHSLAGPVTLAYSALADTEKADRASIVAPGHFIHQSGILAEEHAASISLAKSMVSSAQGDTIATFQTYNNGVPVAISATALDYLSMHDTSQFPDILSSIPLVTTPTLWLAGQNDPLTSTAKTLGVIDAIPVSVNASIQYKEVTGNHFTVLENVPTELSEFF